MVYIYDDDDDDDGDNNNNGGGVVHDDDNGDSTSYIRSITHLLVLLPLTLLLLR
jgi:hypothetical protein